jgi:hypothetical protein
MEADELQAVFDEGEQSEKLVWLKHRFDPRPVRDAFCIRQDGRIEVSLYCAGIDDYEGSMTICPGDVEWAHVSKQTYHSVLRDRLTHAETTQTLVRLFFSDSLPPQLAKHDFYTSTDLGTEIFCFFVAEARMVFDSRRSRIPLNVLLDIENCDIPNSAVSEYASFEELMLNPNLKLFWEKTRA